MVVDEFGHTISVLDYIANSKQRRHIAGGILLSVSLLFGGIALTIMTIKPEEDYDE